MLCLILVFVFAVTVILKTFNHLPFFLKLNLDHEHFYMQQEKNWPLVFNVKDAWFCEVFRDVYLSMLFNKKTYLKKGSFSFPNRLAVSSSTSLVIVFSPRLCRDFSMSSIVCI